MVRSLLLPTGVMRVSLLTALAIVVACSSKEEDGSPAPPPDLSEVTFYEDVAPLLNDHCVGCHHEGGIAPFALTDYASARAKGVDMVVHTGDRHMPPMPVDNSGACNTYSNARWLSDTEIATIAAWVEQGSLEGDPENAPEPPPAPIGLDNPDVTLDPGVEYLPNAAEDDDYRCFVLDSPVAADTFVTAYEVLPGDPRVVHHVIIYQPNSDEQASAAESLDAAEPGEGYTCFGGPQVGAGPLVLWAPGAGVVRQPQGTGVRLSGGRKLIMQVHYNTSGGSYPDRSQVLLDLESSVDKPARYFAVADTEMRLEPGQALVETSSTMVSDEGAFTVYGALPHMHTLGRTLRVEVKAGSVNQCLVNVDRWNFHWQNAWWYTEPLHFASMDSATIRCGFDTTSRSEMVTWGEGTMDEMCLAYLYVSAR
jgi:hypothetical protein